MTPTPREERRERQTTAARRWSDYVNQTLATARLTPAELAQRSGGAFSASLVSKWGNGENTASIENALLFSDITHRPAEEALRAAGHETVADRFATTEVTGVPYVAWARWFGLALDHADLTLEQFAKRAGVPTDTAERWHAGQSAPHTADIAINVAHLLRGNTVAAVAAAGHPRTAEMLEERSEAIKDHPIIQRIRADAELTQRDKEALIVEVMRRQEEEVHIFERRVADAVKARREAQRERETGAASDQRATG